MLTAVLPGCGGTQPLPDRALATFALRSGTASLLFDCGEGTQTALRRCGISLYKLTAVLLTHYHGDHIFGLPGLWQTMASQGRTAPLTITGPAGLGAILAPMQALAGPLPFALELHEFDENTAAVKLGGLTVTAFALKHRVPCCGYACTLPRAGKFDAARAVAAGIPQTAWRALQQGETVGAFTPAMVLGPARRGLKVVYATDTRPCDALRAAAQDADLLCMDATYADDADLDKAQEYGHATCREAGELAAGANVRRLWLTHYSAAVSDTAPGLAAAQACCPAAVAGYDGLQIEIPFDET